jgi:outer membrane protein assembly factor BamB
MGTAEVAPGCVLLDDAEGRIAVTEISVGSEPVAAGNVDLTAWTPPPLVPEPETVPPAVEVLGRRDLGRRISIPPASGEGLVVIVDHAGKVRAFDSQAAERWAFDTGALCASRPAVDGPVVFAATARGGLVKLAAADGRLLVSRELGERVTSQLAVFRDASGRSRLLAGTVSGRLICLDGETLETVWMNAEAKDVIPGRPLVAGGRVVFGSWDARLRAVDASTGRSLWAWIGTDNFYYAPACAAPVSDGRSVFICAPDGFVSAVTLETGRIIWREKYSAWESLTLSSDGTGVLVKSRLGELHVLEAASGRLLRTAGPARGPADTMPIEPVEWGGRILYGAIDGRVYEVDGAGRSRAVLDLGKAGVHSLAPLGGGRFAAVSLDGTVVTFAK